MSKRKINVQNFRLYAYLKVNDRLDQDVEYEFDRKDLFRIVEFEIDEEQVEVAVDILKSDESDDVTELFMRSSQDENDKYWESWPDHILKRALGRVSIISALGERHQEKATGAIYKAMTDEFHSIVRVAAAKALIALGGDESLVAFLSGVNYIIRSYHDNEILIMFCKICETELGEILQEQLYELLEYNNSDVKIAAINALIKIGTDDIIEKLLDTLSRYVHLDEVARVLTPYLVREAPQAVRKLFEKFYGSDDEEVRLRGLIGLYALGEERAIKEVKDKLDPYEPEIGIAVAEELLKIDPKVAVEYFEEYFWEAMFSDKEAKVCEILSGIRYDRIVEMMLDVLKVGKEYEVMDIAHEYLQKYAKPERIEEILEIEVH